MKDDLAREHDSTVLDALQRAVAAERWTDADRLAVTFLTAHLAVHDGYRNLVARLLTWICTQYGDQELERLNEAHGSWQDFGPAVTVPARELVHRIADINHWHMSRFRLVEDDAKITFLLQPCGSGGRLINEGRYYSTAAAPYALVHRPSASTFGMPDFPVYCNHCSEMSRTILQGGGHGWIIEGWTADHRWGGCRLHVYKRYESVNRDFFDRLGLRAPVAAAAAPTGRIFTDSELRELSDSAPDRMLECIRTRDAAGATERIRQARASWAEALRPAYRLWTSNLYLHIDRRFGSAAFSKAVRATAWELLSKAQELAAIHRSEEFWTAYWRETGALRAERGSKNAGDHDISLPALFTGELRPLVLKCGGAFQDSFNEFLSGRQGGVQLERHGDAVLSFRFDSLTGEQ
jgi:hypothetical protein